MYIENIKLKNFRNYKKMEMNFNENINIIFGDNASGKTNILEAIFLCGLGKSFRTNQDKELIKIGEENSEIEVNYIKKDRKGSVKLFLKEKKIFFINGIKVKKTSEILGNLYIVLFTPEDIGILKNEPSKRRRFLNIMISQLRPNYMHLLNQYNKVLEQRNNYLKQIKKENKNKEYLEIWDEQLVNIGIKIYEYRKEFIEKINEKIKQIHLKTTENKEKIAIKYITNIDKEKYLERLKKNINSDIFKGYTSIGIHRDDFEIIVNEKDISKFGSQGQQRTSIISLKLAEAEVLFDEVEEYPIILLDDFISELDKKRIKGFFKNINKNQIFITCTDKLEIEQYNNFYKVSNAIIEKI